MHCNINTVIQVQISGTSNMLSSSGTFQYHPWVTLLFHSSTVQPLMCVHQRSKASQFAGSAWIMEVFGSGNWESKVAHHHRVLQCCATPNL